MGPLLERSAGLWWKTNVSRVKVVLVVKPRDQTHLQVRLAGYCPARMVLTQVSSSSQPLSQQPLQMSR